MAEQEPTPRGPSTVHSRRLWLGLTLGLLVGLAYGCGVGYFVTVVLCDPWQPSPGMAAFGAFVLGIMLAFFVVPIALGVVYWLTMRGGALSGCAGVFVGYAGLLGTGVAGVVAGILLYDTLWTSCAP